MKVTICSRTEGYDHTAYGTESTRGTGSTGSTGSTEPPGDRIIHQLPSDNRRGASSCYDRPYPSLLRSQHREYATCSGVPLRDYNHKQVHLYSVHGGNYEGLSRQKVEIDSARRTLGGGGCLLS